MWPIVYVNVCVIWYHVLWCTVMCWAVLTVVRCDILWCDITSCHVMSCHVMRSDVWYICMCVCYEQIDLQPLCRYVVEGRHSMPPSSRTRPCMCTHTVSRRLYVRLCIYYILLLLPLSSFLLYNTSPCSVCCVCLSVCVCIYMCVRVFGHLLQVASYFLNDSS